MTTIAKGNFTVELTPQGEPDVRDGVTLGRMTLRKRFEGDLAGTGDGVMLTTTTAVKGSAGYVAMERVTATVSGRSGSFALQHAGTMDHGAQQLSVTVVPDSGTGGLADISGVLRIRIADGQHFYEFEHTLPAEG